MSGEESLAQVNREIEAPKLKNLERAGFVIFLYSLLFTSLVSFFAVMLIPDAERAKYLENLIGGLSMFLAGPYGVRLLFHGFVVLVGTLVLAGAVNTAIIGSNGVLNRVAEDGVLPSFFRLPHPKFGTSNRIINLIVGLQLLTILISRGDVKILGEAYAFGVVWSFAMKALAVIVLRFKQPEARAWKVPLNLRIGAIEWPIGLALITLALFALALEIVLEDSTKSQFHIFGQHPTQLWPEDFERIHKLWLEIFEKEPGAEIRHRDVVSVALCRLDEDFHSDQGSEILNEIRREALEQKHGMQSGSEQSED